VQAMFRRMSDEFGTIDILVNNAGLQQHAPLKQMTRTSAASPFGWRPMKPITFTAPASSWTAG
jgi:NAD(P)-dependent dehydrogenase (short-subunit alcohol dehydrogenase family)